MRFFLAGLLVLWLAFSYGDHVAPALSDFADRGRRLADGSDVAGGDPAELAAAAAEILGRPVDVDAFAVATMIRSEAGLGPVAEKAACAWVAINDSRAHGWSMIYTIAGPDRRFGHQAGWRYASGSAPYEDDLRIAEACLSGQIGDPTGGAVKFVHISAFGIQPGTRSFDDVAAAWAGEGITLYPLEGARADFRVGRREA